MVLSELNFENLNSELVIPASHVPNHEQPVLDQRECELIYTNRFLIGPVITHRRYLLRRHGYADDKLPHQSGVNHWQGRGNQCLTIQVLEMIT
jgi:hypothetical protein